MVDERKSPLERAKDGELVELAGEIETGALAAVEMMRRLKDGIEAQARSSTALGGRIWWLNVWLLVFTIAIFVLTAALLADALGWLGHR